MGERRPVEPMTGEQMLSAWMTPAVSRRAVLTGALGLLGASFVPVLSGCSASGPGTAVVPNSAIKLLSAGVPRQVVGLTDAPDLAAVVAGMGTLGTNLHRVDSTTSKNWTVSPLSLSVAFGMLRAGARGQTGQQLDNAFGYPPSHAPEGSPHAALNALTAALVTTGPSTSAPTPSSSDGQAPPPVVAIANGIFLDSGFADAVRRAYLRLLATQYGADAMSVRFADLSASATINAWVASQTRERIKKLFDSLDPATVMVLANAVYLKATWASQFEKSATVTGPFQRASGGTVHVPLMHQVVKFAGYAATAQWEQVTLRYAGGDLAMRIVLPRGTAADVPSLTSALTTALAPTTADSLTSVDLTLPRWNTTTSLPLIAAMRSLGVTDVFGDSADLSGIAPHLVVSDAVHRANITVDEFGTEAAAVTGLGISVSSAIAEPVTMTVDRPFAWAVVHEPTGTPVFAGHVIDPTAAA